MTLLDSPRTAGPAVLSSRDLLAALDTPPVEEAQVPTAPSFDELRARLQLVFEAAELRSQIVRARIQRHADVECRRLPDRLLADVQAAIEARHDVGQSDRVDVVDGGRVRIVADSSGVACDEHDVAQSHRVRAEE